MRVLFSAVLVLVALEKLCWGAIALPKQKCQTKLGRSYVKNVPTTTSVKTVNGTVKTTTTSTRVKTITPVPVTSTKRVTKTAKTTASLTGKDGTATFTVDVINIIISKATATTTSNTVIVLTGTKTSTTTVPTPAGFTPLAKQADYVPIIKRRDFVGVEAKRGKPHSGTAFWGEKGGTRRAYSPPLYPSAVVCKATTKITKTETITSTASKTSTKILAPVTKVTTKFFTTTKVIAKTPPGITSVSTIFNSRLLTSTSTVTTVVVAKTTVTKSGVVPGPTVYAACAKSNLVDRANGGQIVFAGNLEEPTVSSVNLTTAYDCCVACHQAAAGDEPCRWSYYFQGECSLVSSGTCTPGEVYPVGPGDYYVTNSTATPEEAVTISNGPCGAVFNGGSCPGSASVCDE